MAATVGELKRILAKIPDDLALNYSGFGVVEVSVVNISMDAPTQPFLHIEEIDELDDDE